MAGEHHFNAVSLKMKQTTHAFPSSTMTNDPGYPSSEPVGPPGATPGMTSGSDNDVALLKEKRQSCGCIVAEHLFYVKKRTTCVRCLTPTSQNLDGSLLVHNCNELAAFWCSGAPVVEWFCAGPEGLARIVHEGRPTKAASSGSTMSRLVLRIAHGTQGGPHTQQVARNMQQVRS
jgi:hypothetical protein